MSVFTLPDGRVFHAGTYFPARRRGQIPSFTEVLHAVRTAWAERRAEVEDSAAKIADSLGTQRRQQSQLATRSAAPQEGPVRTAAEQDGGGSVPDWAGLREQALSTLADEEDESHGGFGAAPKFPPSPMLGFLLEDASWDPHSASAGLAARTVATMARSALFDQIEGGFARYATDRAWALPHFEKMLSDNAQLLGHCARMSVHPAVGAAQREEARRTARQTVDFLRRRMLLPEGLLASSLDAESEDASGECSEGAVYLFSDAELRQAAAASGCDAEQADQLVQLNRGIPAEEHPAQPAHVTEETPRTLHFGAAFDEEQRALWEQVLPELRRRRTERPQPARDEKVVASWNAQAVCSLAEAASLWEDPEILAFAEDLGGQLWEVHAAAEGASEAEETATRVLRTSYGGVPGAQTGTLADHAQTALACFALASAGAHGPGEAAPQLWTDRGCSVLTFVLRHLLRREGDGTLTVLESLDESGPLRAAQGGEAHAAPFDGPEPSGVAVAALALQAAEALELIERLPGPAGAEEEPPRAPDLLHHLALAAPRAPLVVGASLLAASRAARRSPAFRVVAGAPGHPAEVRRAGALYGVPVEPVAAEAIEEGRALGLSVCLNSPEAMVCLPPAESVEAAVEEISRGRPRSQTP